jgi:hypothetical protein
LRAFCIEPREHVIRGGLQPGPKALFCELFRCRQRSIGGNDFRQCPVGGLGFLLPFAQAFQRASVDS